MATKSREPNQALSAMARMAKTPELAAIQAKKEEGRLPGIAHAESEDTKAERKQVEAETRLIQLQDEKDERAAAKAAARAAAKAKKNGASVPPASQTPAPVMEAPATDNPSAPATDIPSDPAPGN